MSDKKPKPLRPQLPPKTCPGCGKPSYSAAGVHPQCSVRLADELQDSVRKKKLTGKEEKKKKSGKAKTTTTRWQKVCPQCKVSLHVRKKKCDCGHKFNT